jgi:hypothetical protein
MSTLHVLGVAPIRGDEIEQRADKAPQAAVAVRQDRGEKAAGAAAAEAKIKASKQPKSARNFM